MSFTFNEAALRRELQQQVQSTLDDVARKRRRALAALHGRYAGRPVSEIKPALQRIFRQDGGDLTDPELSQYAEAISSGTRITFTAEKVRW
ncbi:hypothetical protein [Rathayibacter sp. AY1A5]|uniref:hypothetical protein n=1 Tax=Rathayibacter sp. AY1A5 TaxID=2080523 RepID=UPI000CE782D4|nr:hypothetical protein [Rathayibacter sp. AY1A5]PPF13167.1 hypothetical protein C5B98_01885 [Rathayibacter sp. AY1A5]